jgi:transposase
MFVRLRERPNGKISIQIAENVRDGLKVRQKIIRSVGTAVGDQEVERLKSFAEEIIATLKDPGQLGFQFGQILSNSKKNRRGLDDLEPKVQIKNLRERSRYIVGIHQIFGSLYERLGFDGLLPKDSAYCDALRSCVLARIANPCSKKKSVEYLDRSYGEKIPLQKMYRMMDAVYKKEESIKEKILLSTLALFKQRVEVLFFDVTTLYFESFSEDSLREFGFSKDCKFKETQIVLALVSTTGGHPVTYELFPGSTYEGGTLITIIENLQRRFEVEKIILVADRAMFNEKNLKLLEDKKIQYVVAAKLRSLDKKKKSDILSSQLFRPTLLDEELHWIKDFEHKNRRLIVSYSSIRAVKDAKDRSRLLERITEKEKDGTIKVKDLIKNRGTTKFIKVTGGIATINHEKIIEDAKWDGLHGVITNIPDESSSSLLARYRGLWQIEAAFRLNKYDLKMRPIFHWTEKRIRAHIAICFLAYALVKQATHQLQEQGLQLSFERLREELLQVQASTVEDLKTKTAYLLPSSATDLHKKIYRAFQIIYSEIPRALT